MKFQAKKRHLLTHNFYFKSTIIISVITTIFTLFTFFNLAGCNKTISEQSQLKETATTTETNSSTTETISLETKIETTTTIQDKLFDIRNVTEQQRNEARKLFPSHITSAFLEGTMEPPEGFDSCIEAQIGKNRLDEIRKGLSKPTGEENDIAALCLMSLGINPDLLLSGSFITSVKNVESKYKVAPGNLSGWFKEGQEADIMLSGFGFNNSGGPLSFNHPKGIATDGKRLLLADGNNNRILIWNNLPNGNTPPDIVLGQPDFNTNEPGDGPNQMNWPVGVATDGTRVVVADTNNDRILIWNKFPTSNGQSADIILDGKAGREDIRVNKSTFTWPWGIWTDGKKLVISSTFGGYVLIWNTFPIKNNQPADIFLTAGGKIGTPRTITSNGKYLIVGDHNAKETSSEIGNFFWKEFPTKDDQPFDFFAPDPIDKKGAWMTGDFTSDDKLIMIGSTLHIWDLPPSSEDDKPSISISEKAYRFIGGDGASLAIAGNKVYISLYNANCIVGYNNIPNDLQAKPDFSIGSPDINTNTLETNYFITNGVLATNGENLLVSSDFDKKLYVWKKIPDENGAWPDLVYSLSEEFWDNALWENIFALAGKTSVVIWKNLPLDGQKPDITFEDNIGGISLKDLKGVALDDKYFYLSDNEANKVYIWQGIPDGRTPPIYSLSVNGPWRLSSDGNYLVVTSIFNHTVNIYKVSELSSNSKPVIVIGEKIKMFNLPQNAIVSKGSLFIADTGFHRVQIWKNIKDAINGKEPDVILGKGGPNIPPMPTRNSFFNPAGLAFDGSYLWVSELKFSFRILRFSVK